MRNQEKENLYRSAEVPVERGAVLRSTLQEEL
jgi:hypothetical protein